MRSTFDIKILTPLEKLKIKNVTIFRGEDKSGSFGILANHIEFLTILTQSIAIIKKDNFEEYIAFNKGVLIFKENLLTITTRDFAKSKDLKMLKNIIEEKFKKIEKEEALFRQNITRLEKEFIKRMIELEKEFE